MIQIGPLVSVFVTGIFLLLAGPAIAEPPSNPVSSFSTAKKLARDTVYRDHRTTLYCGCEFSATRTASGGRIGNVACGYEPRKNETRGKRLEWEHVMPASFFGQARSCWINGHSSCVTGSGKTYRGRKCCAKVDEDFEHMEADLHNLVPSVGELNGDRSNLAYGIVDGEPRVYGSCDFEIDRDARVIEPAEGIKGDVARVWLYMSDAYGINLSSEMDSMFRTWSENDPPDEWEVLRNTRIREIQGNDNPFITGDR